ncbi:MAG TPA: hypothetical protein ENG63_08965 [Candidatus Desulfofervidus auxilii]|uniref:ATP-binding protein n=1 Tax=Desulfofervidus auxilii TaxID=1621989 RepID=A0A7C0Y8A2_DESA2|nr:hypothetical protein [Candidatus Desulfofervidus auxilii]
MRGLRVKHPVLGEGKIIDTRLQGYECLVQFATGLTIWVKRRQLVFLDSPPEENYHAKPLKPIFSFPSFKTLVKGGREVIEAFRAGIVPANWIKSWTVGRARELAEIKSWLHDQTSGTLVIKGEYGAGKTHLIEYLYHQAKELNYAVARVSIDPFSTQLAFPKRIYRELIQSLRVPHEEKTLNFRESLVILAQKDVLSDHKILGPFLKVLKEERVTTSMWHWIEGFENLFKDFGVLYDHTTAANIYCYILSGLSRALVECFDVKGLVLLFDETEVSRIYRYTYEWQRGINFLKGLVLVANDEPELIEERVIKGENYYQGEQTGLVYSGYRKLPYIYQLPTYLKVAFAVTPDFSLEKMMTEYNIYTLELEPLEPQYLEHFFYRFVELYYQVYRLKLTSKEKKEIFSFIREYASISTRLFIKAMVECLDFKRFYPGVNLKRLAEEVG